MARPLAVSRLSGIPFSIAIIFIITIVIPNTPEEEKEQEQQEKQQIQLTESEQRVWNNYLTVAKRLGFIDESNLEKIELVSIQD